MPVNVRSPACQVKSAIPMIKGMAAVIWFSGLEKSTLLVIQMRTPRMPTNPYSTTVAPPSTPGGMAEITAPTLGHNDNTIATAAAIQYAAVEYTRVAAITPMFSAYVVVADPPPKPANVVATPSAASARPINGSTSVSVIWPTDLKWPMFSATSAMTAGRNIGSTATVNVGVSNSGGPTHD